MGVWAGASAMCRKIWAQLQGVSKAMAREVFGAARYGACFPTTEEAMARIRAPHGARTPHSGKILKLPLSPAPGNFPGARAGTTDFFKHTQPRISPRRDQAGSPTRISGRSGMVGISWVQGCPKVPVSCTWSLLPPDDPKFLAKQPRKSKFHRPAG